MLYVWRVYLKIEELCLVLRAEVGDISADVCYHKSSFLAGSWSAGFFKHEHCALKDMAWRLKLHYLSSRSQGRQQRIGFHLPWVITNLSMPSFLINLKVFWDLPLVLDIVSAWYVRFLFHILQPPWELLLKKCIDFKIALLTSLSLSIFI